MKNKSWSVISASAGPSKAAETVKRSKIVPFLLVLCCVLVVACGYFYVVAQRAVNSAADMKDKIASMESTIFDLRNEKVALQNEVDKLKHEVKSLNDSIAVILELSK